MPLYDTYWKGILQRLNAECDFSNSFEKTYSDTGIENIGNRRSSGFTGYLELFAFNTRKKTNSQVFRDLEEAIKKYSGLRNKLGGLLNVRIGKTNEVTFKYEPFSWELMMNRYSQYQDETRMADEIYKWERVQEAQEIWQQYDAGNLNFKQCFSSLPWDNLIFYQINSVWSAILNEFPDEFEDAVLKFCDGEESLQQRVETFRDFCILKHKQLKEHNLKNHGQEERGFATLLTYRHPEMYTLYMDSFYSVLAKCLGQKPKEAWYKLAHYYEIVENFRKDILPKYEDVIAIKNNVTEGSDYYPDNQHLLLVQDIFYITLMKGINDKEEIADIENNDDLIQHLQLFEREEVEAYFDALDIIRSANDLNESDDQRFFFSLADKRLNFTIGQRYILNLLPEKQRKKDATYLITSTIPISKHSDKFNGSPAAICNRLDSLDLSTEEWSAVNDAVKAELDRTEKSSRSEQTNLALAKMAFDHAYREEIINLAFPQEQDKVMSDSSPKNIILFGPPGTGKTFNSIDKAVSIIEGTSHGHEANKKRYDELVAEGQIQFVTFHQSMSYEDFVEGIKPETIDDDVVYNVKPGIFKQICNQARADGQSGNNFETAYKSLLKEIKDNGGKLVLETLVHSKEFTVYENSKGNLKFHSNTEKAYEGVIRKDFISHFLLTGECKDWPSYVKSVAKHMKEYHGYASKESKASKKFVLIIDEINRGNVSQIFGELITLIEEDKREGEKNAISVTLPYSKNEEERFSVPSNLYIIGTMNTADRSVEALDSALRRRFSFIEMPPKDELLSPGACYCRLLWDYEKVDWEDKEYKKFEDSLFDLFGASETLKKKRKDNWEKMKKEGGPKDTQWKLFPDSEFDGINLQSLLRAINQRIEKLLDKDHLIGHSYLINVRSESDLRDAFRDKIIPLLQEYFFGDFGKIGLVLGKSFLQVDTQSFEGFADFEYESGALSDLKERVTYRIAPEQNWNFEAIMQSVK